MNDLILASYDLLRGLHILAVIAWMAGLLYLPRLYVYHCQAEPGGELDEKLKLMEDRLLRIIMRPAMIATWLFGLLLVWANIERAGGWEILLGWGWAAKLVLILGMTALNEIFAARGKTFAAGTNDWPEKRYRMINEAPFLLAIGLVLIATIVLR